ncbi:hypothetical protein H0H93_005825 [Arthromyces matolae]|nr:hypothetical protein H0H93_005825 [Arthromyces matolae]
MPKRGAEKDLNKDNADVDDEEVSLSSKGWSFSNQLKPPKVEPSTGFAKAQDED